MAILVHIWKSLPFWDPDPDTGLAGDTSQDLFEAADVDGASWWRNSASSPALGAHPVLTCTLLSR